MIKNYFKIAWRNLLKNKGYSAINIGGLAVGMAVAILIGLWIYDELSFNTYHKNYDDIAQIWVGGTDPETSKIDGSVSMPIPLGAALKNNYGQNFKHVLMAWWIGDYTLSLDNNKFIKKGEFIEAGVPDMLSLKMLSGTYAALNDPHSIILSKSAADVIFGKEDPMNKSLKIDNRIDVNVTGVYYDIPKNNRFSEVQFFSPWALWVSSNDWIKQNENNWDNRSFNIYVQKNKNATMDAVNASIKDAYVNNVPKDFLKEIEKYKPFVQAVPMNTWHLYSEFKDGKPAGGRISFVWLFGIVGIFVLLLACINFMNLSTARSEKRAKEVGIRKAIGSLKSQLVKQFLSESFLVTIIAFLISVLLVALSLSWFNEVADKEMRLPFSNTSFWLMAITFIILTGFLAGLYPAFYLSSFKPVKVLKGVLKSGRFASLPRKVLVVVQFSVSVVLIIGTIIVYRQIQHARNRPVGYNREGLITLSMPDPNFYGKQELTRNLLQKTGFVEDVAYSQAPVTAVYNNSGGFSWKGRDPNVDNDFALCRISQSYGKTVGWKLIDGRDFSTGFSTDSTAIIINESAAKYMKLENPVGEFITHESSPQQFKIIGVVKDLIMQSPYEPVKQSLFVLNRGNELGQIIIKLKPDVAANKAIPKIEAVFKTIVPTAAFDYKFVDEEYGQKFSQEQRIGKLSAFFAILAIFISCLGLFGLASFVAEQRTKEIGIRKVVGASVFNLWQLLSKDFIVLVIVSCFIAIPIAYYYMNGWLQKYQYRTTISWYVFAIAIGGALLITLLTVSFQAIKAAIANP
ncbi:MAG: ABC transporter permease, partial [Bacteroidia bacterium]|nr:ABC transporter permease [Bacteroidia bacterium]